MLPGFFKQTTRQAYRLFYPSAALFAALSIALWVANYLGILDIALSATQHAHEMLFGFALAIMTGFLLNGVTRINLALLVLLWLGGRFIVFVPGLSPVAGSVLNLSFPLLLASLAALPLFKNAKSWRNLAFAPILSAFFIAETLFQTGQLGLWENGSERGLLLALDLISAMVFMMGGRVVTAVTNGALQAQKAHLKPGAQSYWEEKGFFALLFLAAGDVSGWAPLSVIGGIGLSVALILRLYHWGIHRTLTNPQCLWLHIGFGWLLVGIMLRTFGLIFADAPFGVLGIHTITIAALGTLSLTIMTRSTQQRLRQKISLPRPVMWALAAINFSLLARILMETGNALFIWGWTAAISYTLAYILFALWFFHALTRSPVKRTIPKPSKKFK